MKTRRDAKQTISNKRSHASKGLRKSGGGGGLLSKDRCKHTRTQKEQKIQLPNNLNVRGGKSADSLRGLQAIKR